MFGFWGFIIWLGIMAYFNNKNQAKKNINIEYVFDSIIRIFSTLVLEDNIITREEVKFDIKFTSREVISIKRHKDLEDLILGKLN